MTREEIIKELIEDMSKCGVFVGKYDAENGSEIYMYGVNAVMEYLAYEVSDEYGDAFSEKFTKNMIDSENKIRG
jgi:hypothetical protein